MCTVIKLYKISILAVILINCCNKLRLIQDMQTRGFKKNHHFCVFLNTQILMCKFFSSQWTQWKSRADILRFFVFNICAFLNLDSGQEEGDLTHSLNKINITFTIPNKIHSLNL